VTVHVKLFAVLREAAGTASLRLDLPDGATVADARDELLRRCPALAPHLRRCAFAVNRDYCAPTSRLSHDAELALIPPVSGG
jgi:molybdopterin converting factor subunit 1